MKQVIGLDFGGSTTEIYVKGKGIVLREPSIAAVDCEGNVVAVGSEALLIRGRAPGSVTIRRPIRDSEICDFNLTAEMLDQFLKIATPRTGKKVLVSVKCGISQEQRFLIEKALRDCRVSKLEFIESPLAALKGCGLLDSAGILVCDIGSGSVECSYIKNGEILRTQTYFGGGCDADQAITDYLRRKYDLSVTKNEAQNAKHKLDMTLEEPDPITLTGLDTLSGMPKKRDIPVSELLFAAAPQITGALDCISAINTNLPRYAGEADTVSHVLLVGGGAMLPGLGDYISNETGLEVIIPENPLDSVTLGLGAFIEEMK